MDKSYERIKDRNSYIIICFLVDDFQGNSIYSYCVSLFAFFSNWSSMCVFTWHSLIISLTNQETRH